MIKKILLALDHSSVGKAAREYALSLAKTHKAFLTGMGVLDIPWIVAGQPQPLGGGVFKQHRDQAVIKLSKSEIHHLIEEFKTRCKEEKLSYTTLQAEGFPASEIEKVSQENDVLVIGKTTDFHFDLDTDTDITVKHIARDNPRPMIVVSERSPLHPKNVLVCLDGDLNASRALHVFLLLGLGKDKHLTLLSINEDLKEAKAVVERGARLCEAHGVKADILPICSEKKPEEEILKILPEKHIDLVVMGAFTHTLLREVLFGSCTKTLMKSSDIPLFLYH